MDLYESIVTQFISELEIMGLKKTGYAVVKLPTKSYQGFFSSIPLLEALNKYGLRANLKTVRIPKPEEGEEKISELESKKENISLRIKELKNNKEYKDYNDLVKTNSNAEIKLKDSKTLLIQLFSSIDKYLKKK